MTKVRKILAVVNPHTASQPAATKAARLADALDAQLTLHAVVPEPAIQLDIFHLLEDRQQLRQQAVEHASQELELIAADLGADQRQVSISVDVDTRFHDSVQQAVTERGVDLVVLAPRDQRHHRLSQSEWRLLHDAKVPVLLARDRQWSSPPRLMACVDPAHQGDEFGTADHRILEVALELHQRVGELEVLHALHETPSVIGVAQSPEEYRQGLEKVRTQRILRWVPEELHDEIPLHFVAAEPEEAIESFSHADSPADLVIMGVFSRTRLGDLLIGSTARKLMPRLKCDVLAVPVGHPD